MTHRLITWFSNIVLLCLAQPTSAQECPDISKLSLPSTEGGVVESGATTYRGEIQIWNRPESLHWVIVRGCGGGGGGSSGRFSGSVLFYGGVGGEGAAPEMYLLGPLKSEAYLIVAGGGGRGAPAYDLNRSPGENGQNGCPSEIYELDQTPDGLKVGRRLLHWRGGRGNGWIKGEIEVRTIVTPEATSYSLVGASGSSSTPRIGPSAGGGAGLGDGGNGGISEGDSETGAGKNGGDCAGGGGGGVSLSARRVWAGGAGGPGVLTLLPVTDLASLLPPSEPSPPASESAEKP